MIIYSLLWATKEETTTRNLLVVMSVRVTGLWAGPPFTPDLAVRHLYILIILKSSVDNTNLGIKAESSAFSVISRLRLSVKPSSRVPRDLLKTHLSERRRQ